MIPASYADAFKALRANVAPLPFSTIIECIEHSLGHPWQETFSSIDEQPLGSASVAQVHRACLKGESKYVAVKVRRPHVVQQMAEDLTLMKHALALADLSHAAGSIMLTADELVNELERTTAEELDFCIESDNLVRFHNELEDQAGITSPCPYPNIGADDMLVMEYVEGTHINDLPALQASGDDPAELGQRLAENYVTQVIDRGFSMPTRTRAIFWCAITPSCGLTWA